MTRFVGFLALWLFAFGALAQEPPVAIYGRSQVGLNGIVSQTQNGWYIYNNAYKTTALLEVTEGSVIKGMAIPPGFANSAWFDTVTNQAYLTSDGELVNPTPAAVTGLNKLWGGGTAGTQPSATQLSDIYCDAGATYVVRWLGSPSATVTSGLTNFVTVSPGRKEGTWPTTCTTTVAPTMNLSFSNFDHSDPPRKIEIFRKFQRDTNVPTENLIAAGQMFDTNYLTKLKQTCGVIRGMDWFAVNNNLATKKWTDIPGANYVDYSVAGNKGVWGTIKTSFPVSDFTTLANLTNCHPWYNFGAHYGESKAQTLGMSWPVTFQQTNGVAINVNHPNHGFQVGSAIFIPQATAGVNVPPGVSFNNLFVSVVVDADNYQISATQGGASILATTTGNLSSIIRAATTINSTTGAPVLWAYNHGLSNGDLIVYYQFGGNTYSTAQTGTTWSTTNGNPITFNKTAHNLPNGLGVTFANAPVAITPGRAYYIVNAAANTYQVALTAGGSPVNATATTSGTATATAQLTRNTFQVANATSNNFELVIIGGATLDVRNWVPAPPTAGVRFASPFSLSGITTEVTTFCNYVQSHLNAGLVARYEYGNEYWNSGTFELFAYLAAQARIPNGTDDANWMYGYLSAHYMKTLRDCYGVANRSKWMGVWGTQTTFVAQNNSALAGINAYISANAPGLVVSDLFDVLAVTGYFGTQLWTASGIGGLQAANISNSAVTGQPATITLPSSLAGASAAYEDGAPITFSCTGGGCTLPSPIVAGQLYFVTHCVVNVCNFATGDIPAGGSLPDKRNLTTVSTTNAGSGSFFTEWNPEQWAQNVVSNSDDRFLAGLESTRYAYFNRVIATDSADCSYSGTYSCQPKILDFWDAQKTYANGLGLQLHQYEGGSSLDINTSRWNATYQGAISGTALTLTGVNLGNINIGDTVWCDICAVGTRIVSGSGLNWTVNISQTVSQRNMQNAMRAFFANSSHTPEFGANFRNMYDQFFAHGGLYPSKFTDINPVTTFGNFAGLPNPVDNTPDWDATRDYNRKTLGWGFPYLLNRDLPGGAANDNAPAFMDQAA